MAPIKKVLSVLMAVGMLSIAAPQLALASEIDDLKAALQALQAKVNMLEEEQQKQAVAVKAIVPASAPAASNVTVGSPQSPLSINVGGGTVTLYGNVDEYLNYMKSSSGARLKSLQDGAYLRSRLGFKGDRELAPGYTAKFQLEQGFNITNGSAADTANVGTNTTVSPNTTALTTTGRLFDRQAWAGVNTPYGEFRFGRQNTAVFFRGDYVDFGSRTLGSPINEFGVPSRYDGDIFYQSPRLAGFQAEAHYAIAGSNPVKGTTTNPSEVSVTNMGVYQLALDYLHGPFRVGYAGIDGRPETHGTIQKNAEYHMFYANYDYGRGKLYGVHIRTNNGGGALSNVGGNIVSNNPTTAAGSTTGSLNTGLDASLNTYFDLDQLSADYKITAQWRVGGIWGKIKDTSDKSKGAKGWALGSFYDYNSNLMLYALLDSIDNETNASFTLAGSAGLTKNFSGTDATGKRIDGVQGGFVFKF